MRRFTASEQDEVITPRPVTKVELHRDEPVMPPRDDQQPQLADQVPERRAALGLRSDWDLTVGTATYPTDGETASDEGAAPLALAVEYVAIDGSERALVGR